MREINEYKKRKVIKLFLTGVSYDEITQELGIAKGSVVNIVNDFREGRLKLPPESAEYIDSLRKVAVDMRKNNTDVNQLTGYMKIHNKIQALGIGLEDIEDWLEVSRELASVESGNRFKEAALELARLRKDKGIGYTELLEDYQGKMKMLGAIKDEIAKKNVELKKLRADEGQARLKTEKVTKNLAEVQRNCNKRKLALKQDLDRYLEDDRPSEEIAYPTVEQICEVNRRMIEEKEFGGLFIEPGNLLNLGALEYILDVIQFSMHGITIYPTLKEKAAAIAYHIISRHVFNDGNKRTGTHVAWEFLCANKRDMFLDESIVELTVAIAQNEATQEELLQWLHEHQAS